MSKSKRPAHDRTSSIKEDECNSLLELIENDDGVALAMAPVQLWLSVKPNHKEWCKAFTGILCFIKDYKRRSFFFRLFSLLPAQLWEQEIYIFFNYISITKNFYYFTADESNAGFNFTSNSDAEKIKTVVMKVIETQIEKKASIKTDVMQTINKPVLSEKFTIDNQVQKSPLLKREEKKREKNKENKKIINKSDISGPTGFTRLQHIGFDQNSFHFNLSNQDEQSKRIRDILDTMNLPINKKTEKIVNNLIESIGGFEKFENEIKKSEDSQLLVKQSTPIQPFGSSFGHRKPPPPPPRTKNNSAEPALTMESKLDAPFPPPPPPTPVLQSLQPTMPSSSLELPSTSDSRELLLNSIINFQGFNKTDGQEQRRHISYIAPAESGALSIFDQLKQAIIIRSEFLNDPSDDSNNDTDDSDWG